MAETVIDIMQGDYFPLSGGAGYVLVGSTSEHPDNHYGTPGFVAALQAVGSDFNGLHPNLQLRYNDMSLVWGGLFDCGVYCGGAWWNTPHSEHRMGTNMDLSFDCLENGTRRALRQNEREDLLLILSLNHISWLEESNHWHLQY